VNPRVCLDIVIRGRSPAPIENQTPALHLLVNYPTSCPGDVMSDVTQKVQVGWFCSNALFPSFRERRYGDYVHRIWSCDRMIVNGLLDMAWQVTVPILLHCLTICA
jgi:hypothetical protein